MYKVVVFKVALFDAAIRKLHASITMLDSVLPLSFEATAISPMHFPIAMTFILNKVAFVYVAAEPLKYSAALPHVISKLALISVRPRSRLAVPLALSMFFTVFEVPDVETAVLVLVPALAVRLSKLIITSVGLPIQVQVVSGPVFEPLDPLSFILLPIWKDVHSVSMSFGLSPLPNV